MTTGGNLEGRPNKMQLVQRTGSLPIWIDGWLMTTRVRMMATKR